MNRFPRWMSMLSVLLIAGAMMALGACSSNVKSEATSTAKEAGAFGTTVKAYKSGQFLLDGAIVSSLDLSSHFAYLRDQHELPQRVLLERSDKSKIRKDHLRYMAAMAHTYGFTVYYDKGGDLRQIIPTASDQSIKLRGSPKSNEGTGNPEVERNSANHGGNMPQRGRGY
jgi:hypothetical protein